MDGVGSLNVSDLQRLFKRAFPQISEEDVVKIFNQVHINNTTQDE